MSLRKIHALYPLYSTGSTKDMSLEYITGKVLTVT